MAGARSFERGEAYFTSGQVGSLAEHQGTIAATVQGTQAYRVKLGVEAGEVRHSCTCPVGQDGVFCKHGVAVGLAWLDQQRPRVPGGPRAATPAVSMDDVGAWLAGQEKHALVELLMDQAMADDRLRQRLLLQAAKGRVKGLDLATYKRAIDEAVAPGDFVDYHAAHHYAAGIDDVIDSIEELLADGFAAEVITLSEHALEAVEAAMEFIDDSDGYMSGVFERLQTIHLKACRKVKPDPGALARRLFAWELRTDWDTFYGAVETYAGVLGKPGLAMYQELAEAEWAKVPSLGPKRTDAATYGERFRITQIMETLARQTGDVEAVVAVKRRDLSSAYAYLQIAEAYRAARKHDLALEWAERGVNAFPDRTDWRLREFLAREYHRRQRHDEAMALVWAAFAEAPALEQYRTLKAHADKGGRWTEWRAKALGVFRQSIAAAKREPRGDRWGWYRAADHTELVRVLPWEHDVEAAWREATEGGCSNGLWMELARKREAKHPEDALRVYQRQVEPVVNQKNNQAYREAVGLLRTVHRLMKRLGRTAEFARYLESVRVAHKAKRNFIKLLDGARWS